jgi:eukaryotic-like serine/threonine-protein kinase
MSTGRQTGARLLAGRYRLVSVVGRGGMGTVWQARDEVLDRDVAVKEVLVHPGLGDDERAVLHQRTLREARATARLNHPAIVTVHDVVDEDDRPWIVMEFLTSRSLQEVIDQDGPQSPQRVAEIGRQVLGALRAAHAVGVLHRDVKPGNVLLTQDDRAVLTDFGIAQVAGDTTLTQHGLIVGSPAYIAPERAQGLRAEPAADLWALGATLYTACEGRPPYDHSDAMAALTAILTEHLPPPRRAGPLQPVLWGLLERDPARRMGADAAADLLGRLARNAPAPGAGTTPVLGTPTSYDPAGTTADPVPAPPHDRAPAPHDSPSTRHDSPSTPHDAAPPRRRGTPSAVIGALVVLVVLAVATAGFLILRHPQASAPASAQTSASPTTTPGQPRLPAGWHRETGPGYTIGVPAGWAHSVGSHGVFWRDPASVAYVQVDRTQWPGEPYLAWQQWEKQVMAERTLRNYDRLALRRVAGTPYAAADIEFTWDGGGGIRMHGVDRRIISAGQRYAVFVAIPEAQWNSSRQIVTGFLGGFAPAR